MTNTEPKLQVHRLGTTVSVWKGNGARVEMDVRDVAVLMNALGFPLKSVGEAHEWAEIVHHMNSKGATV